MTGSSVEGATPDAASPGAGAVAGAWAGTVTVLSPAAAERWGEGDAPGERAQDAARRMEKHDAVARSMSGSVQAICAAVNGPYETGEGVVQDRSQAAEWYREGCSLGDEWGCERLRLLRR